MNETTNNMLIKGQIMDGRQWQWQASGKLSRTLATDLSTLCWAGWASSNHTIELRNETVFTRLIENFHKIPNY